MNVLKSHLRITIETLLERGATQREIERFTGVDRKTIRRYQRALANSPGVATGSEHGGRSKFPHPGHRLRRARRRRRAGRALGVRAAPRVDRGAGAT